MSYALGRRAGVHAEKRKQGSANRSRLRAVALAASRTTATSGGPPSISQLQHPSLVATGSKLARFNQLRRPERSAYLM